MDDPSCKTRLNLNNIIVTTYSENQNPKNSSLLFLRNPQQGCLFSHYRKTLIQMRLRVQNNCSLHKKGNPSSSSQHLTITLQVNNLSLIEEPKASLHSCSSLLPLEHYSRSLCQNMQLWSLTLVP
ncbi:hypothetical protein HKD37_19G052625 [Glycine soja]